jgi:hypothetical protein
MPSPHADSIPICAGSNHDLSKRKKPNSCLKPAIENVDRKWLESGYSKLVFFCGGGVLSVFDAIFNIKIVIWLFPLAYLLHDLEEIFTVENWMHNNRAKLLELAARNKLLRRFANSVDLTTGQFTVAFLFLFIFVILSSYSATRYLRPGIGLDFYLALIGVMFLHVFTHVGQTILFLNYTPGVVTAVLVMLPYTLYSYHRLFYAGLIDFRSVFLSTVIGVIGIFPLLLAAHALGRKLYNFP